MDRVKNIDDWGKDKITHVSLMVNSPHFEWAVEALDGVDVGLHLTLTTDTRSYRKFIFDYLLGVTDETDIYLEWKKQIVKFLATGLPLTRVDSHHGVHFYPRIWEVLQSLMEFYDIPYVRNPPRKFCWFHLNPKMWISKNKSWLFWKININYHKPLPYKEEICHIK